MDKDDLRCPKCCKKYNNEDRQPKIIPICGHTICLNCISEGLDEIGDSDVYICPIDQKEFKLKEKSINRFPNNITLAKFIPKKKAKDNKSQNEKKAVQEESPYETCPEHNKPLDLFSFDANKLICNECAIFGSYKGQKVKRADDIHNKISQNGELIDQMLSQIDSEGQRSQDMVSNRLKQKRSELEDYVKERFNEYVDILCSKGEELIKEIRLHFKAIQKELKSKDLAENQDPLSQLDDQVAKAQSAYEEWKTFNPNKVDEFCFNLYDFKIDEAQQKVDALLEQIQKNYQKKLDETLNPIEVIFDETFCVGMKRICRLKTQIEENKPKPPVMNANAIKNLKIREQYTPNKKIMDISQDGAKERSQSKTEKEVAQMYNLDASDSNQKSSNKKSKTFEDQQEQFDIEVQKAQGRMASGNSNQKLSQSSIKYLNLDQAQKKKIFSPTTQSPKDFEGEESKKGDQSKAVKRKPAEVIAELMVAWGLKFDASDEDIVNIKGNRAHHSKITDTSASKIGTALHRFTNATHLHIDVAGCGYQITSQGIIALCSGIQVLSQLRVLDLNFRGSDVGESGVSGIGRVVSKLKDLKKFKINIGESHKVNDRALQELGLSLSQTHLGDIELYFPQCTKFGDKGLIGLCSALSKIDRIPGLKKFVLNMTSNDKISDSGLTKAANLIKEIPTLEQLEFFFDNNNKISNSSLSTLATAMSKSIVLSHLLKTLTLSFKSCSKITKKSLEGICTEISKFGLLQNLALDFSYCESIDNDTLTALSKAAIKTKGSLKTLALDFQGCEKIGENGMVDVCLFLSNLQYLTSLKINVSDCKLVKDEVLSILSIKLGNLTSLKTLNLSFSRCSDMTDDAITALSHALRTMPTLEEVSLYFAQNQEIGDHGIEEIAESIEVLNPTLSKLKLNFNSCERIGSKSIEKLNEALYKCAYLQHLELHFNSCNLIGGTAIRGLGDAIVDKKRLEHVEFYFYECPKIDKKTVSELEKKGEKIEKYYVFI